MHIQRRALHSPPPFSSDLLPGTRLQVQTYNRLNPRRCSTQGIHRTEDGEERVVLKRVKARVQARNPFPKRNCAPLPVL